MVTRHSVDRMRIAVVCPYGLDQPGGVQAQAIGIAEGMRNRGHDAWVVGPSSGHSPPPGSWKSVGPTVGIRANRSVAPVALRPGVVRTVRRAIAPADVVHIHEPFVPLTSWSALATDARLVLTFHADPSDLVRAAYRLASPLLRRLINRADVVTAVSPVAASALSSLADEVREIPNGVALPAPSPRGHRRPHCVTFLGRDEPRKGLDTLLAAWPRVRSAVPDAELLVMGATRSRLPPGVTALGTVEAEQKWEQLSSSSIFCAPNLGGESFGITLVEGMAAGCAVVASELPAFAHVLGDTGRLVATGDVAELGEVLIELLGNPDEVRRLGAAARKRAGRFSWDRVLDAYESTYRSNTA